MKQLIKKPVFWLIAILVIVIVNVVFADHIGRFFVRPTNDATQVFVVMDKDGNPVFEVNTSTDGAAVTGALSVSGAITATGGVTGTNFDIATTNITAGSGFWDDCPSQASNDASKAFFYTNDFVGEVLFPTATGVANGWKGLGDATYDVLSAAGTLGGWCLLAPEAASNNELYLQMGQIGTETFVEFTASSGKEVWLEYNLTPSSVTNAACWFVGLAEEGLAAENVIADAGDDFADKDLVGFVVWEGDPNALLAVYQTEGGAFATAFSTAITAVNITLGIHFDGATTVTWYVDGTAIGTKATTVSLFPDTEELTPSIFMKQGAAAININLDWIKLVVER